MNAAQEAARRLMGKVIPDAMRERLNEEHGLEIAPGATCADALSAKLKKCAAQGDPEAKEIMKEYGIE